MEKNFTFKNRNYSYNADTKQISRLTAEGTLIPVSGSHPSLTGILDFIEETVVTR
jgi:hypothetical protein